MEYGMSSRCGHRKAMEDTVATITGFMGTPCDLFTVYDDHNGGQVSEACPNRMHVLLAEEAARSPAAAGEDEVTWWTRVLPEAFKLMDQEVAMNDWKEVSSTALVALQHPISIFSGW